MKRSHETYRVDFDHQRIGVPLADDDAPDRLVALLQHRHSAPHGRCVKARLLAEAAEFRLKTGDKLLVPGGPLTYLCDLDEVDTPCMVFFFRPMLESGLVGNSVLWHNPPLHNGGIDYFTSDFFPDDDLHNGALGYEQRYSGFVLRSAVDCNVYGSNASWVEDRREENMLAMRADLKAYYRSETAINPASKDRSKIKKITLGMLGKSGEGVVHAKGGESRSVIKFAWKLNRRFVGTLQHGDLLEVAGSNLLKFIDMLRAEPRVIEPEKHAEIFHTYLRFVNAYRLAGGHMVPKFHAGAHMIEEIDWFGNPRHRSTWEDEAENGADARIATKSHCATFCLSVFQRIIAGENNDDIVVID